MGEFNEREEVFQPKIQRLEEMIKASRSTCVFTGAGVSTLSGIPDFRGAHGVYTDPWHGMDVEDIVSIGFFEREPSIFYQWAKAVWYNVEHYQPTIVHTTLAKMERMGYMRSLYTQNIDMLHERAGSKAVYDVHGSVAHHHCPNCGKYFPYEAVAKVVQEGNVPHCDVCGHVVKPDIVLYGESLDSYILNRAYEEFSSCDLCLVLGSSLTVQPAASFPVLACRHGAKLVIVNAQPTMQDDAADLLFSDLEQVFSSLDRWLDTLPIRKKCAY